jgi:hypothetical protein
VWNETVIHNFPKGNCSADGWDLPMGVSQGLLFIQCQEEKENVPQAIVCRRNPILLQHLRTH